MSQQATNYINQVYQEHFKEIDTLKESGKINEEQHQHAMNDMKESHKKSLENPVESANTLYDAAAKREEQKTERYRQRVEQRYQEGKVSTKNYKDLIGQLNEYKEELATEVHFQKESFKYDIPKETAKQIAMDKGHFETEVKDIKKSVQKDKLALSDRFSKSRANAKFKQAYEESSRFAKRQTKKAMESKVGKGIVKTGKVAGVVAVTGVGVAALAPVVATAAVVGTAAVGVYAGVKAVDATVKGVEVAGRVGMGVVGVAGYAAGSVLKSVSKGGQSLANKAMTTFKQHKAKVIATNKTYEQYGVVSNSKEGYVSALAANSKVAAADKYNVAVKPKLVEGLKKLGENFMKFSGLGKGKEKAAEKSKGNEGFSK